MLSQMLALPGETSDGLQPAPSSRDHASPGANSTSHSLAEVGECSLTLEPVQTAGPMPSFRNPAADRSSLHRPAPRQLPIITSIGFAHRTQMTGWGNVVREAVSDVLPTF